MSTENNISFDDNKFKIKSRVIFGAPEVPSIIKIMVKKGLVKNENQAIRLILILIILLFGTSVFLINRSVRIQPATVDKQFITNNN